MVLWPLARLSEHECQFPALWRKPPTAKRQRAGQGLSAGIKAPKGKENRDVPAKSSASWKDSGMYRVCGRDLFEPARCCQDNHTCPTP